MKISVRIGYNGKVIALERVKPIFEEALFISFDKSYDDDGAERFKMEIHPKQDVRLDFAEISIHYQYKDDAQVFCNGYQSWTESRCYHINEDFKGLRPFFKRWMSPYGDYDFDGVNYAPNTFHSWSYSYIKEEDESLFIGSLREHTGFTLIKHQPLQQQFTISKDCRGLSLKHSYPIFDFIIKKGELNAAFEAYFKRLEIAPPRDLPTVGWTSWYHYYTNISEAIILENLKAFRKLQGRRKEDFIFQIDDGYQTAVGDWLSIKKDTFPRGMGKISQDIHACDYKAGLWLAPFICEKKSTIFKNKKNWLLKDDKGKPVKAGYNPLWSGYFYALDFSHKEVQEYLAGVFHKVLHIWRFDLLKLDFLYAVALAPPPTKTRGQVMYEAMTFLRRLVGDKMILACGVPLASAFGLVDYCRIGADIHLSWEHRLLAFARNRERVSTLIALRSVLGRWELNGKVFWNDPDVFLLRNEKNKLNLEQKKTVLLVNTLLGNLLFTSDLVSDYDEETRATYKEIYTWKDSEVLSVEQLGENYTILFCNKNKNYKAYINLSNEKVLLEEFSLPPFATRILETE